jgi:hypothetical protein
MAAGGQSGRPAETRRTICPPRSPARWRPAWLGICVARPSSCRSLIPQKVITHPKSRKTRSAVRRVDVETGRSTRRTRTQRDGTELQLTPMEGPVLILNDVTTLCVPHELGRRCHPRVSSLREIQTGSCSGRGVIIVRSKNCWSSSGSIRW